MKAIGFVLIACVFCIATGCVDSFIDAPNDVFKEADLERTWSIVHDVYPYFAFKRINWDSLHAVYQRRAAGAQGDEMYQVLFDLLAELKDGHVQIKTPSGTGVRTYITPREERDEHAFDPRLVWRVAGKALRVSSDNAMEYGILDGNIGYIRLSTFMGGPWSTEFGDALDAVRSTRGLILDLRHNGGGSDLTGFAIIRRFITSPLALYTTYYHGVAQHGDPLPPAGPYQYTAPVVVLINGKCFSATEDIAEVMTQIPTFTLLGDTTAGASGAPQDFSLPSGKRIAVSTIDFRRYDGQPIEWNGVPPDIRVQETAQDVINGNDFQLQAALALLR